MDDFRKVEILTPEIYEWIGKIVTKASYLEFALYFMACATDASLENNSLETLKYRNDIKIKAKTAVEQFAKDLNLPIFLLKDAFFSDVTTALNERDSIAHGIIQRVGDSGLMAFHPRGERNVRIDPESLESIYWRLDKLEVQAYAMRNIIWERSKDRGLIQLGALEADHLNELPGTRLG